MATQSRWTSFIVQDRTYPAGNIEYYEGTLQRHQRNLCHHDAWQCTYRQAQRACLGRSSAQLCSDLPNLITLLHAGMYEGQAPACTFHSNNLPLGIWPGSLPQRPTLQTGSFAYWGSCMGLTTVLPENLLKITKYTNKIFSLSYSTGTTFYIGYLHIFQPLF